jgi:hypothetical protein
MTFIEKLEIFLSIKNHSYSEAVDEFIQAVIKRGKCVRRSYYDVHVILNGRSYKIWAQNQFYADLSQCCFDEDNIKPLWFDMRPARKTQIRFWEWVEENLGKEIMLSPREREELQIFKPLEGKD